MGKERLDSGQAKHEWLTSIAWFQRLGSTSLLATARGPQPTNSQTLLPVLLLRP